MEKMKAIIAVIGTYLAKMEELQQQVADRRWITEMHRRLGSNRDAVEKAQGEYESAEAQLGAAERLAVEITGKSDLEEAITEFGRAVSAAHLARELAEDLYRQEARFEVLESSSTFDHEDLSRDELVEDLNATRHQVEAAKAHASSLVDALEVQDVSDIIVGL